MDRSEYALQSIARYRVRPSRFKVKKARDFYSAGEGKVVYKSEGRNYGAKFAFLHLVRGTRER